jgi:hypothetical protein
MMSNMTHRGTSGSFGAPAEKDGKHSVPSTDTLDAYALERWEVRSIRFGFNAADVCP